MFGIHEVEGIILPVLNPIVFPPQKTDIMCELVDDIQLKTKEFLHPNPASRAKMSAVKGISKLSGQAKAATYPQPEGVLGEAMAGYGKKIGEDSMYGEWFRGRRLARGPFGAWSSPATRAKRTRELGELRFVFVKMVESGGRETERENVDFMLLCR